VSNWFTQLGTAFNNAMAQSGQAQITNAQANQAFWNAVIQEAPAAYQAGIADGNWAALPGAAIGGPIGAGLAGAAASETGPGALAAAAGGYPVGQILAGRQHIVIAMPARIQHRPCLARVVRRPSGRRGTTSALSGPSAIS
jgi:hypothetical protein